MLKYYIILSYLLFVSCHNVTSNGFSISEDDNCQHVEILEHDISVVNYSAALKMKSCIKLSNDSPLGSVQRALIKDGKLYISDSQPKIVCFNITNGEKEFEISKVGKGPGEFINISDFLVNEENNILTVYCHKRRKIINFSSNNGKYMNEYSIDFTPIKIASIGSSTIFYNPYKLVHSDAYNYNLLFSDPEKFSISSKIFAHDPIVSSYMFGYAYEYPFFYNTNGLFYINRFENTVYNITHNGVSPIYKIILPNSAPIEFWKKKPSIKERTQTNFSQSLTDVYQCGNILHFRFINQKRIVIALYDIKENHVVSVGQMFFNNVLLNVPIICPIRGVYENNFFALADPILINYLKEKNAEKLPDNLQNLKETDNPILIFYETIK